MLGLIYETPRGGKCCGEFWSFAGIGNGWAETDCNTQCQGGREINPRPYTGAALAFGAGSGLNTQTQSGREVNPLPHTGAAGSAVVDWRRLDEKLFVDFQVVLAAVG